MLSSFAIRHSSFDLASLPLYDGPMNLHIDWSQVAIAIAVAGFMAARGESFRVATYNLENYLDEPTQTRATKSAEAKAKVRQSILALKPDVIALQEMGSPTALEELRTSLKA